MPSPFRAGRATMFAAIVVGCTLVAVSSTGAVRPNANRIDDVADGDTVTLRNAQRVRLVQIDTPEVYFGVECHGRQASIGETCSDSARSASACRITWSNRSWPRNLPMIQTITATMRPPRVTAIPPPSSTCSDDRRLTRRGARRALGPGEAWARSY